MKISILIGSCYLESSWESAGPKPCKRGRIIVEMPALHNFSQKALTAITKPRQNFHPKRINVACLPRWATRRPGRSIVLPLTPIIDSG